jgi:hypothetical protein
VTQGNLDQRELYWDLLPDAEYQRAVGGLRAALQLCLSAYRDLIPNQELAAAAIGDFVNWACALDERLENNDETYAARRDADDDGRVLPALRFVLNAHINQMAITSSGVSHPAVRYEPEASHDPDTDLLATAGRHNRTHRRPWDETQLPHAPSRL